MEKIFPGWWQVMVALIIQAVSLAIIFTGYSVVVSPFKEEFAPGNMILMLGITVTVLATGALSPILGTAVDRFSIRKLMVIGVAMIAAAFVLFTFTTSMIHVLLIYGTFMSVGAVLLGPIACTALLARWFTRRRGLAMGIAASGSAVGGLLFPPLLQVLIDHYEWRTAYYLFALLILLITIPLILLFVIDSPTAEQQAMDADSRQTQEATSTPSSTLSSTQTASHQAALAPASAYKDRNFWLIALVIGTVFCGPMALVSNMMLYAGERNIVAAEAAWLLSVYAAFCLVGKLLVTFIIDHINRRLGLAVTICAIGLGMLGFMQGGSYSVIVVACVVTGLASGTSLLFWSVILAHTYGASRVGEVMGKMSLVIMPFSLIAPPLFGWVSDYTGSYSNAFMGYIMLLTLALLVLSQVQMGHRPSHAVAAA